MRYNIKVRKNVYVPLAQPDRVFGYEPKGRGFESLKARQKEAPIALRWVLLFALVLNSEPPKNFCKKKFFITCASCLTHHTALYARLGSESLKLSHPCFPLITCAPYLRHPTAYNARLGSESRKAVIPPFTRLGSEFLKAIPFPHFLLDLSLFL